MCEDLPTDPRLLGPAHAMVWEDRAFCNVGICGLLKALQVSAFSGEMGLVWGSRWRLGWGVSCFPQEGYNQLAAALRRLGAHLMWLSRKCFNGLAAQVSE